MFLWTLPQGLVLISLPKGNIRMRAGGEFTVSTSSELPVWCCGLCQEKYPTRHWGGGGGDTSPLPGLVLNCHLWDSSGALLLFRHSVVSNCLQPHAGFRCPSLFPGVCSDSYRLSQWCSLTISSSAALFSSCSQVFPRIKIFPMSLLFASGGQSIGASASASVLPMHCYFTESDFLVLALAK